MLVERKTNKLAKVSLPYFKVFQVNYEQDNKHQKVNSQNTCVKYMLFNLHAVPTKDGYTKEDLHPRYGQYFMDDQSGLTKREKNSPRLGYKTFQQHKM